MVINPCGLSDFSNIDNYYYSHNIFRLCLVPNKFKGKYKGKNIKKIKKSKKKEKVKENTK